MAEVVLFHSVLGLRPGVIAAAYRLRAAGHTVHTPDLYDGETFDELEDGMSKEEALGYREITRRAREAVVRLPEGLVFAGFSMGVAYAGARLPGQGRRQGVGGLERFAERALERVSYCFIYPAPIESRRVRSANSDDHSKRTGIGHNGHGTQLPAFGQRPRGKARWHTPRP